MSEEDMMWSYHEHGFKIELSEKVDGLWSYC